MREQENRLQKKWQNLSILLSIGKTLDETLKVILGVHVKKGMHQLQSAEEEWSKHDLQLRNV